MATLFSRWGARLGRSDEELEAKELQESTQGEGVLPIAKVHDRQLVTVRGTIRSLTFPSPDQVPALIAELYDGTATIALIWLGRREIRGIHPGTYLQAQGRVAERRGEKSIFNPIYEIRRSRDQ